MGNFKRGLKKAVLVLKKHSPEILMGIGCVSLVGAVGTAIWKTATCDKILDSHDVRMAEAEERAKEYVAEQTAKIEEANKKLKKAGKEEVVYTDGEKESDIDLYTKKYQLKEKFRTAGKLAWHYAPTAVLTALSATSFLGAFCIIKGRYTMVCGALTATTAAFEKYRERVREDVGEEKDLYYRYGVTKEKINGTDENGKKTKEEVLAGCAEEVLPDGFFRFIFDDRSGEYYKDMATNIITLNGIRHTLNMDLEAEGHLTAKEIFKRLDVWKLMSRDQKRKALYFGYYDDGDTYVDFDLYRIENKDKLMHPDCSGGDFLILELKGLRPLDQLI